MSMTRAPSLKPLMAAPVSPLGRLGSWSYRHRWLITVAWVAVLVVISLGGRLAGSAFKDNLNGGTSTPSQQAASFLQRSFPAQAGDVAQVVFQTSGAVNWWFPRWLDRIMPGFLTEVLATRKGTS